MTELLVLVGHGDHARGGLPRLALGLGGRAIAAAAAAAAAEIAGGRRGTLLLLRCCRAAAVSCSSVRREELRDDVGQPLGIRVAQGKTVSCEMPEMEVSSARTISAMRWMFVCVSVSRMALLLSFEVIVALFAEQRAQAIDELGDLGVTHGQDLGHHVVAARDLRRVAAGDDGQVALFGVLARNDFQDAPAAQRDVALFDEHRC